MDDQKIVTAIDRSPLQPEDKQYWKQILNQMSLEQKQRFYHTVVVKTDVKRASQEIASALNIINKALEEEQTSDQQPAKPRVQTQPSVIQEMVEQTNVKDHVPEQKLDDPQALQEHHQDTQKRLEELRAELANLSQEVNGQTPPSYS